MKARFRIPMSEDKAYAYLLAAIMAEVEYRHRVFCSNEDMEKQLQEMAHWLTTPSSHFGILCAVDVEMARVQCLKHSNNC